VVTALEDLAAWISSLTPDQIPNDQHRLARMRLVDTFGLIAAAIDHDAGKSLLAWASASPGAGATLVLNGKPALPPLPLWCMAVWRTPATSTTPSPNRSCIPAAPSLRP